MAYSNRDVSQERMDQIMEEARLCQEKLEELKMAAVQVAIIITITILTMKLNPTKFNPIRKPHICLSQPQQVFVFFVFCRSICNSIVSGRKKYLFVFHRPNELVTSPGCKGCLSKWSCAMQNSRTCLGRETTTNDF